MAQRLPHPWRTLLIFALVTAAAFGAMAALRVWTPRLGLDLRGGTTVTLTAQNSHGAGAVEQTSMELARDIIQRRIDGLGVGETQVNLSGDRDIVIAVPQMNQDQLLTMVGQTAQLSFRQVIAAVPSEEPIPSASPTPGESATPEAAPSATPEAAPSATPSLPQRAQLPTAPPAPTTPRPTSAGPTPKSIQEAMAYQPTPQDGEEFQAFRCGGEFPDVSDQPLITCDEKHTTKYFLSPVLIKGDTLDSATAGIPQGQLQWQVNLTFKSEGAQQFATVTTAMVGQEQPKNMLAIVLDGDVISSPTINEPITGGEAQISGSFTQGEAQELSNVLKYGALPLTFDISSVDNISPTLGGDQLRAGLIAGLVGLALVIVYSFFYYRLLFVIVVASLAIAAVQTYALLTLLGAGFDLALSLPGIAGAIVAIGVTADSFIIYYERIRDEVREGRSLRTAIESGWHKSKNTIVISDAVSLLSALVLFFLAIGAVKGFAFTLGLTTLIDLAIVFFFTKPLMTILGRTTFFGEGRKWSGLDPEHMGVERATAVRSRRAGATAAGTRTTRVAPRRVNAAGEDVTEPTGVVPRIEEN